MGILAVPFIAAAGYVVYLILMLGRVVVLSSLGRGAEIKKQPTKLGRFLRVVGMVSTVISVALIGLLLVVLTLADPSDFKMG